MVARSESRGNRGALLGGGGALAFGILTLGGVLVANPPGGNYSASSVAAYLGHGHRIVVLVATQLALVGVLGLVALLTYVRDLIATSPGNRAAADIIWGAGLVAAASYAIGWGVIGSQAVAHLEGGGITIPPQITYLISAVGVMFIFGAGSVLLGFALILSMLKARGAFPTWVRRFTLLAGICGVAGLAFFPFFVLMLWVAVFGVWLVSVGRSTSRSLVLRPADVT